MTKHIYRIAAVDGDEERELLEDLHKETFGTDCPIPAFHEGHWWLAYYDPNIAVGFCGLRQSDRFTDCGYLCRAGVTSAHTGLGLQRRLIRVRERKARQLGYDTLFADTTGTIYSANNLIACGYRLYEPKEPYAFETSLYWRKKL